MLRVSWVTCREAAVARSVGGERRRHITRLHLPIGTSLARLDERHAGVLGYPVSILLVGKS